jgi:DNA-binding GntR family transcriptional regulator
MLQLAQAIEDAAVIGDGALYLRVSSDIRDVLCDAAGNEFLSRFMSSLFTLSRLFSFTHLRESDLPRAAATHAGILRAVAALDEEAAAQASQRMIAYMLDFTERSKRHKAPRQGNRPDQAAAVRTNIVPRRGYRHGRADNRSLSGPVPRQGAVRAARSR